MDTYKCYNYMLLTDWNSQECVLLYDVLGKKVRRKGDTDWLNNLTSPNKFPIGIYYVT